MHDVYAAKPLFLAMRRTVDSVAEHGGHEHVPDEIHVADTVARPHCAANLFLTAPRCSKQGAWHGLGGGKSCSATDGAQRYRLQETYFEHAQVDTTAMRLGVDLS